jgi:signal transduction histidine kinase
LGAGGRAFSTGWLSWSSDIMNDPHFEAALADARLEALREFAYGAGHEINNPLANIAARAQALLVDEQDPERRRRLSTIVDQAFRARDMIGGLMVFARPPRPQPAAVPLGDVVRSVLDPLRGPAAARGLRLEYAPPPVPLELLVDAGQLAEALRAVVQNAIEAVDDGGHVTVSGREAGGMVEIEIVDDGRGMDAATLRRAFDPFFSGREAGRGIGLGLPKAWRLVELNGGTVAVDSRSGGGTRVTVTVPIVARERGGAGSEGR